jgi:Protein of unknown function (DUF559)
MKELPPGWIKQSDGSYSKLSLVLAKERAPEKLYEADNPLPSRVTITFLTEGQPTGIKKKESKQEASRYASRFIAACVAAGLPTPIPEYLFAAPERRYRADFAFVDARVMVEIDGGVWRKGGGAHSHPLNIIRDMERTNEATVRGWRLLRFMPEKLTKSETMETIRRAIHWSARCEPQT